VDSRDSLLPFLEQHIRRPPQRRVQTCRGKATRDERQARARGSGSARRRLRCPSILAQEAGAAAGGRPPRWVERERGIGRHV